MLAVTATNTAVALGVGGAGASTEPYALAWVRGDGAEDCPSTAELQQEIEARLGRRVFDARAARSIEVAVHRDAGSPSAARRSEIHIRDANGATLGRRTLTSNEPDCHSLFSSTALAIALVVDPDASTKPSATLASPSAVPIGASRVDPPASLLSEPVRPMPRSVGQKPPENPTQGNPATRQLSPPAAMGTTDVRQSVQIVGSLLISSRLGPSVQPGASLAANVWYGSAFGWSLTANYLYHGRGTAIGGVSVDVGATFFDLNAMLALIAEERMRLLVELGPSVGALHIAVHGAPATGPSERWFVAGTGGLAAQAEFQPNAFLELAGSAVVPFTRDRLSNTAGPTLLYAPSAIGFLGRIGIGTAFP